MTADALRRRGCRIQHSFGFIFIKTKVWISDYGYDQTLHAFDKSTAKLGTGALDLLILHQPLPSAFDHTIGAYKALERLLADGKVRAIGVSNFMPEHLNRLLEAIDIVPAVNQVELHPYFTQPGVQKQTRSMASSPRPGPRSAASRSTAAAQRAPCQTRPSSLSPASTARPQPR